MAAAELFGVLMAGGAGTRFWPASRRARPKQFLPISGGRPMIAETLARLEGLIPPERVLVVTSAEQVAAVGAALPELPPENVLAEPEGRNTAACIGLAACELLARDPAAIQVVLPADHVIHPAESFRRTVAAAAEEAESEPVLVVFGVRPTHPATGYGYVEAGPLLHERRGLPVHAVQRFVEKPDRERAEAFVAGGRHLWNAGMFVWSTAAILDALRRHVPGMVEALEHARPDRKALAEAYRRLPALPIDTAVLERATNVRMLPIDYRWSDVGSWSSLAEVHAPDAEGNWPVVTEGARILAEDAHGCIVYAEEPGLVALLGVRDLVVVRSGDVTLVCPRERAQDVRLLVERLRVEDERFL